MKSKFMQQTLNKLMKDSRGLGFKGSSEDFIIINSR